MLRIPFVLNAIRFTLLKVGRIFTGSRPKSSLEIFKDEEIVTESRDDAFPSTLRLKRSVYQTERKDDETSAMVCIISLLLRVPH